MTGIVARYRCARPADCCGSDLVLDWYWRMHRVTAHCTCGAFLGWVVRAGEYSAVHQVELLQRRAA